MIVIKLIPQSRPRVPPTSPGRKKEKTLSLHYLTSNKVDKNDRKVKERILQQKYIKYKVNWQSSRTMSNTNAEVN